MPNNGTVSRSKRQKKEPIPENALQGFKYFKVLSPIFRRLHSEKDHHNRKLYFDQYIALLLFYFFNPAITSLRAQQFSVKHQKNSVRLMTSKIQGIIEKKPIFQLIIIVHLSRRLYKMHVNIWGMVVNRRTSPTTLVAT